MNVNASSIVFPEKSSPSKTGVLIALAYVLFAITAVAHTTALSGSLLAITLVTPALGILTLRILPPGRATNRLEKLVFGAHFALFSALALPPTLWDLPLDYALYVAPIAGLVYALVQHEGLITRLALLLPIFLVAILFGPVQGSHLDWLLAEDWAWSGFCLLAAHRFWERPNTHRQLAALAAFSLFGALRALLGGTAMAGPAVGVWIILSLFLGWQASAHAEASRNHGFRRFHQLKTENETAPKGIDPRLPRLALVAALALVLLGAHPFVVEFFDRLPWAKSATRTDRVTLLAEEVPAESSAESVSRASIAPSRPATQNRALPPKPEGDQAARTLPSDVTISDLGDPVTDGSGIAVDGAPVDPSAPAQAKANTTSERSSTASTPSSSAPKPEAPIESLNHSTPSPLSPSPTPQPKPPKLPTVQVRDRSAEEASTAPDSAVRRERVEVDSGELLTQAKANSTPSEPLEPTPPAPSTSPVEPPRSIPSTAADPEDEKIYDLSELREHQREPEPEPETESEEPILTEGSEPSLTETTAPTEPISSTDEADTFAEEPPTAPPLDDPMERPETAPTEAEFSSFPEDKIPFIDDENWVGSFNEITFREGSDGLFGQLIPPRWYPAREIYLRRDTLDHLTPRGFTSSANPEEITWTTPASRPPVGPFKTPPGSPARDDHWWTLQLRANHSALLLSPNAFADWELPYEAQTEWSLDRHTIRLSRTSSRFDVRFSGFEPDAAPPTTESAMEAALRLYGDPEIDARLAKLARKIAKGNRRNNRDFLRRALDHLYQQAEYSLRPAFTPGPAPDLVSWLENGTAGYCQHFSSALVLLARAYGIPARVVVGVHLTAEDFHGDRYAITDQSLHAWVEVADGGFWHRIEATPPSFDLPGSTVGRRDLEDFEPFDASTLVDTSPTPTEPPEEASTPDTAEEQVAAALPEQADDSGGDEESEMSEESTAPPTLPTAEVSEPLVTAEEETFPDTPVLALESANEPETQNASAPFSFLSAKTNPEEPPSSSSSPPPPDASPTVTSSPASSPEVEETPPLPPEPPTPRSESVWRLPTTREWTNGFLVLALLCVLAWGVREIGSRLPRRIARTVSLSGAPSAADPSSCRAAAGRLLTRWEELFRRAFPDEREKESLKPLESTLLRFRYGAIPPRAEDLGHVKRQLDEASAHAKPHPRR